MPNIIQRAPGGWQRVERVERRVDVGIGSWRWQVSSVEHRWSSMAQPVMADPDHSPRAVSRSLTLLTVLAMMVLLCIAANARRAEAGPAYRVSVAVPPPARRARVRLGFAHASAHARTAKPASIASTPVRQPLQPITDDQVDDAIAADGVATGSSFTAMEPAVAAAFRSGRFQQWHDDDRDQRGYVVAGPLEPGLEGDCRSLSILRRQIGGDDTVETRRECRPATSATRISRS